MELKMEVQTHKFCPFVFEKKFNDNNDEIYFTLTDIIAIRKAINSLHILPNWAESINERIVYDLMVKSIHGTLAIEGNPSTEKEIEKTLTTEIDINKIKERKEQEAYNIKKACEFIRKIGKRGPDKSRIKLSEEIVKEIHRLITFKTKENNNDSGSYRNFPVEVGDNRYGGVYRPPKILDDIKILMTTYVEWLNSEEIMKEHPIFRAILSHYYLAMIHPFGDGNGRTARAIESLILYNHDFKYGTSFALWRYYLENYEEYFSLLSKTRKENKGDQTEFILFVLKLLQQALDTTHKSIVNMIDDLLFKDYISYLLSEGKLSQRQNAIVSFLLGVSTPISAQSLSEHPVIQGLYGGLESRIRLFQMDMQNIVTTLNIFRKITKNDIEYYAPNMEIITKSE